MPMIAREPGPRLERGSSVPLDRHAAATSGPTAAPLAEAGMARALRDAAALLAAQGGDRMRIAAYGQAADVVEARPDGSLRAVFEGGGRAALAAVPAIGPGIAGAIAEMLVTGRWAQLERLRGGYEPAHAFSAVPGIGLALSRRLHQQLGADSLESLEAAARDGRLEKVRGMGPRRSAALCMALASVRDAGPRQHWAADADGAAPPLAVLLDVDREYRERARRGELAMIAPRRFNPLREAWLAVLHARRGPWHLTALYSNTARGHELGCNLDWVVVYAYDDDHREYQHTIVTGIRGSLLGRRVVRGFEAACRQHYERAQPAGDVRPPSVANAAFATRDGRDATRADAPSVCSSDVA